MYKDNSKDNDVYESGYGIDSQNPFGSGLELIGITIQDIHKIANFFEYMYQYSRKDNIARYPLTMIQGAVFAIGTSKLNNPEWKEHCASSIREIMHAFGSGSSFVDTFISIEVFKEDKKLIDELDKVKYYYNYFTGIDHHEPEKVIYALKGLGYSIKWDEHNNFIFIEQVKNFFDYLLEIISYLKKEKNIDV